MFLQVAAVRASRVTRKMFQKVTFPRLQTVILLEAVWNNTVGFHCFLTMLKCQCYQSFIHNDDVMKAMDTFLRIKNLRKYVLDHKSLVLGRTQYKLCYCISKKKTWEMRKVSPIVKNLKFLGCQLSLNREEMTFECQCFPKKNHDRHSLNYSHYVMQ